MHSYYKICYSFTYKNSVKINQDYAYKLIQLYPLQLNFNHSGQQDGVYLSHNTQVIQPEILHDASKSTFLDQNISNETDFQISPTKQGTFWCETWHPFTNKLIASNKVLVTLQEWDSFVISLNVHSFSDIDIYEIIYRLKIRLDAHYKLFSPTWDFIRIQDNTEKLNHDNTSSLGEAKYHFYVRRTNISDNHEFVKRVDKYINDQSTNIKHTLVCTSESTSLSKENVVKLGSSIVVDRCYNSTDQSIARFCQRDFNNGARYESFTPRKCFRFDICPRGFTNVLSDFCVKIVQKYSWEKGFRKAFTTGLEVTLLDVLISYDAEKGKSFLNSLKDIVRTQYNESITWLPIRRIRKHGQFFDVSLNPISLPDHLQELELKLGNNLTFTQSSVFTDECVAFELSWGKLFTLECSQEHVFLTIVNISSLIEATYSEKVNVQTSLLRDDLKCKNIDGFAPGINLLDKTCIIIKFVEYIGWEQAQDLCHSFEAALPQPMNMFMNWVYKQAMKRYRLSSIFVQNNNALPNTTKAFDQADWQMNTGLPNMFGIMSQNGWSLSNSTTDIPRKVLFCEKKMDDHTSQKFHIHFGRSDNILLLDISNIENPINHSLICYRNGRIQKFKGPTDLGQILELNMKSVDFGYINCIIWKNNPLQRIKSNTLLQIGSNTQFSYVAKLFNSNNAFQLSLMSHILENNITFFFEPTTLDICQKRFSDVFLSVLNNVHVKLKHNFFAPTAYQYISVSIEVKQNSNYDEKSLFDTLQSANIDGIDEETCNIAELRSTVGCKKNKIKETVSRKYLNWPSTVGSGKFQPTELCIDKNGVPISRECIGDFMQGYFWSWKLAGDCSGLPSRVTKQLYDINNKLSDNTRLSDLIKHLAFWHRVNESVVLSKFEEYSKNLNIDIGMKKLSSQLSELTNYINELQPVDITLITKIFNNMNEGLIRELVKILPSFDKIIQIMNNVLTVPRHSYGSLRDRLNTTNELLVAFEKLAFNARISPVTEETRQFMSADKIDLSKDSTYIGFSSSNLNGKNKTILLNEGDAEKLENITAEIILPEHFNYTLSEIDTKATRVIFIIYYDDKLFLEPDLTRVKRGVNSQIVQASVENLKLENLKSPVKMLFKPLNSDLVNSTCVYWEYSMHDMQGGWSSEGCWMGPNVDHLTTCFCNHLTSFALLINFENYELSAAHTLALNYITTAGCLLSMFGLLMVFLTFSFFEKWRKSLSNKILFNLSIAIFFSLVLFVGGITRTSMKPLCRGVAVLLHYFILASFNWMLVEGIHQYLRFVKVIGNYIQRFLRKAVIFAWGFPILPVIVLLVVDENMYDYNHDGKSSTEMCWISPVGFKYAFLPHLAIVMLINIIIFIRIIVSVVFRRPVLSSTMTREIVRKQEIVMTICVFSLLGFTWIFGVLSIVDPSLLFSYLFSIFNSLQGFIIFILHITRDRSIRKEFNNMIEKYTGGFENTSMNSRVFFSRSNAVTTEPTSSRTKVNADLTVNDDSSYRN